VIWRASYVAVVTVLVAVAFRSSDRGFSWPEGVAMVLTLPALLVALPAIYVIGAGLWSITDAGDGGPMWPVTVGFAVMFGGVAVANTLVVRAVARRWAGRRSRSSART
jgi:phage gp37-like protein